MGNGDYSLGVREENSVEHDENLFHTDVEPIPTPGIKYSSHRPYVLGMHF